MLFRSLPGLRDAARRSLAADRITARWLALDAPSPPRAPPEFVLALPIPAPGEPALQSRVAQSDGAVGFDVRVQIPGQKSPLNEATLRATAFAPDDRRVIRLLGRAGGTKKSLRAHGSDAALALHFLRALPADRALLEGVGALTFDDTPLSLAIVRARLPRSRLALSLAPADPDLAALQGRGDGIRSDLPPVEIGRAHV